MRTYRSKAFVYQGKPGAVTTETLTLKPGPRDILVKVMMAARCGTDKTIYRSGHANVDPYAPVVLGHELVARIAEVGDEVRTLTEGIGYCEGQRLPESTLTFTPGERLTFQSRIARYRDGLMLVPRPIANLSFQINGGYSQYMIVPETMIRSGSVLARRGRDQRRGGMSGRARRVRPGIHIRHPASRRRGQRRAAHHEGRYPARRKRLRHRLGYGEHDLRALCPP